MRESGAALQDDVVIETSGVDMRYGDKQVLNSVTFQIRQGEVVALLGPNGAGKTTTIEILEGLRNRSSGHVRVLGEDPEGAGDAWRSRTGVVLQSWRDHARWTPRMLISHMGEYYAPFSSAERKRPRDPERLIEAVGLSRQADQRIRTLSGGERRRLDVAIGLVGNPEVLFLDEPTAGLDPHGRREFHDLVCSLRSDHETTIMLTTHDLAEAERLADRILVMGAGRIIANGSARELAAQVSREVRVRWRQDGADFSRMTEDPISLVRELLTAGNDISDLEVRRASLEETYLALVHRHETGQEARDEHLFEGAPR